MVTPSAPLWLPRLSFTLSAVGDVNPTVSGNEGITIGMTITATHDEQGRSDDTRAFLALPSPRTVSLLLLTEFRRSAIGSGVTHPPQWRERGPKGTTATF